jgi:hypothetical protein
VREGRTESGSADGQGDHACTRLSASVLCPSVLCSALLCSCSSVRDPFGRDGGLKTAGPFPLLPAAAAGGQSARNTQHTQNIQHDRLLRYRRWSVRTSTHTCVQAAVRRRSLFFNVAQRRRCVAAATNHDQHTAMPCSRRAHRTGRNTAQPMLRMCAGDRVASIRRRSARDATERRDSAPLGCFFALRVGAQCGARCTSNLEWHQRL